MLSKGLISSFKGPYPFLRVNSESTFDFKLLNYSAVIAICLPPSLYIIYYFFRKVNFILNIYKKLYKKNNHICPFGQNVKIIFTKKI